MHGTPFTTNNASYLVTTLLWKYQQTLEIFCGTWPTMLLFLQIATAKLSWQRPVYICYVNMKFGMISNLCTLCLDIAFCAGIWSWLIAYLSISPLPTLGSMQCGKWGGHISEQVKYLINDRWKHSDTLKWHPKQLPHTHNSKSLTQYLDSDRANWRGWF